MVKRQKVDREASVCIEGTARGRADEHGPLGVSTQRNNVAVMHVEFARFLRDERVSCP